MSEIFFDRFERGHKTILINTFELMDFIENTTLKNIMLKSTDNQIIKKIDNFFNMNNEDFFSLLGISCEK